MTLKADLLPGAVTSVELYHHSLDKVVWYDKVCYISTYKQSVNSTQAPDSATQGAMSHTQGFLPTSLRQERTVQK